MDRRRGVPLAMMALFVAACGGPPATPASAGPVIEIVAANLAFEPKRMTLPAGAPIQFVLVNRDEGVPHGIVVATRTSGVQPVELGRSEIVEGFAELEFNVVALPAGPYLFSCPVHPIMQIEVDAT